jgi:hypothetical protein
MFGLRMHWAAEHDVTSVNPSTSVFIRGCLPQSMHGGPSYYHTSRSLGAAARTGTLLGKGSLERTHIYALPWPLHLLTLRLLTHLLSIPSSLSCPQARAPAPPGTPAPPLPPSIQ